MKYVFIALLWLPFVLLTDLFPFMRFGMFAEPIKTVKQTEVFIITKQLNEVDIELSSVETGITVQDFNYLARNYFYKNKSRLLLQNISKTMKLKTENVLKLKKITINLNGGQKETITVCKYVHP